MTPKKHSRKAKPAVGKNKMMALSFGALNLVDYMTTRKILNSSGEELNPVADFLIRKNCFGIFKTAATLAGILAIYEDEKPRIMSKAFLGFYGFLVAHNLKEIVRYKKDLKNTIE